MSTNSTTQHNTVGNVTSEWFAIEYKLVFKSGLKEDIVRADLQLKENKFHIIGALTLNAV